MKTKMNAWRFTIEIFGYGDTAEEAWEDNIAWDDMHLLNLEDCSRYERCPESDYEEEAKPVESEVSA